MKFTPSTWTVDTIITMVSTKQLDLQPDYC